ncbi:OsmC family protein [Bergeyella cardium]|uniref:OsmC family peroxiredoxin n=1 Tax=Bergeyella cardium TaxID=1585976 RepID=A0A6P1QSN7_9FLAO|nr:OsmC family protein [Bergeyella cardium]QHN64799.1 OsmC family peroxiredoxin [Bergeyella cardium]WHE34103.1 OsmC family protein [Bergeyella cardium]WHF60754.1 OsmC family protein [Bergeyella cardium]
MKIKLSRLNDNFLFEGYNEQGNKIKLDNTTLPQAEGASPMEAVLMAVAGCSGIDIIAILKKQRQQITNFSIEVEGERMQVDEAKPFKSIHLKFIIDGEVEPRKALKAAELSFEKYCSVSKSLNPDIKISYEAVINGNRAED